MSKKEDLARRYTDNLMQTSRPYHVETYGLNLAKNMATFDAYYLEGSYRAGWNEALNQLWHEATKTPQDGKTLLAINEVGTPFICGPNNSEWEETIKVFRIVRWCYIEDLL